MEGVTDTARARAGQFFDECDAPLAFRGRVSRLFEL
jgi:hypothetical protein